MKRKTAYIRYSVTISKAELPPPDEKEDWRLIYFE